MLIESSTRQRGSKKVIYIIFFIAPPAKFRQLYIDSTPSEIWNMYGLLVRGLSKGLTISYDLWQRGTSGGPY
jgi:hypothetical protein